MMSRDKLMQYDINPIFLCSMATIQYVSVPVEDITTSMTRPGGAGSALMAGYIRSPINIQDDSLLNI